MRGGYIAKDVIAALTSVVTPAPGQTVPLHEPLFSGNEWSYLKECLDSGWVSSVGTFVERLEQDLAAYTGAKRAIAVVNGTAALHIALLLAGVHEGDEVLVPTLTFVATANAVIYCGAIPHFVDSEERTLGMDPAKLARHLEQIARVSPHGCVNKNTGRRIKAALPMHTFGHPVDLAPLMEVCRTFGIEVVEDAAEALGSLYRGRHVGRFGRLSVLSFNGNKTITTGGGGAILTDDEAAADRARHLTTTAKVAHCWAFEHDEVGFNYRMPNLNAAVGCAQLESLPALLAMKRILAERYRTAFSGVAGVTFFSEPDFATSNYWLNTLLLDPDCLDELEPLLAAAHAQGITLRPAWRLLHRMPIFASSPRMDLSCSLGLEARIVNLPSSPALGVSGA